MMRKSEEGVALLTVLLLVAVMSALAIGVLDDIRFGIKREANAETVGQAQWYALGAETLVRARIAQLGRAQDAANVWNGQWLSFPVDNGAIATRLSDATQCFNVNSVVQGAPEQWSRREIGISQFSTLLRELGTPAQESERLAEALADWIDTDTVRNTMGAEDDSYANSPSPYRTSGTLLGEVSELRAIRGFTPELYARIRPYLCALPTAELSPININLLQPENAVLLTMLMDGALDVDVARRIIAARPLGGWKSIDAFWQNPALLNHLPPDAALNQLALESRFFNLESRVTYAGAEVFSTSLFERGRTGTIQLAARRWTVDE